MLFALGFLGPCHIQGELANVPDALRSNIFTETYRSRSFRNNHVNWNVYLNLLEGKKKMKKIPVAWEVRGDKVIPISFHIFWSKWDHVKFLVKYIGLLLMLENMFYIVIVLLFSGVL